MALTAWVTGAQLVTDRRWNGVNLPSDITPDDVGMMATEIAWARSGRRFNAQAVTVRPHRLNDSCDYLPGWAYAGSWNGWWTGWSGSSVGSEFLLGGKAIAGSVAVTVEGVAFSAFAVLDGQRLIRQDGYNWPPNQNLAAVLGTAGTWSVTYTRGSTLGRAGFGATHDLACEIALLLSGSPETKLKGREIQTTRSGALNTNVSRAFVQMAYTQSTKLGLPMFDMWIESVNPKGLRRRPSVTSPDMIVGAST